MATYTTSNDMGGTEQNLSTTYKTLANVLAAASAQRRGMIISIYAAANGAPSVSNNVIIDLSSMTANDGTATTVTATKSDQADAAAASTTKVNFTAEGTIGTAGFLHREFNQLVAYEWEDELNGIIWPATANTGFALRSKGQSSGYASTMFCELGFVEL